MTMRSEYDYDRVDQNFWIMNMRVNHDYESGPWLWEGIMIKRVGSWLWEWIMIMRVVHDYERESWLWEWIMITRGDYDFDFLYT